MELSFFTDVHCHILPGIDDGARDREMMTRMLQRAYDDGIRNVIATSHYHPARYRYTPNDYMWRLNLAGMVAKDIGKDMHVFSGSETFYIREDTVRALKCGEALTLAGSPYVLVEFAPVHPFEVIKDAVSELVSAGYRPVIAHVERYGSIHTDENKAALLCEMGAWMQVNASSITRPPDRETKKFLHQLLSHDRVHLIASDAHNLTGRPPGLSACGLYIKKRYGNECYSRIFMKNPECIIRRQ